MDDQDDHAGHRRQDDRLGACGGGDGGAWLDCQEAIETLYYFLDGELTEIRRVEISRHLAECSPCLGAFDFETELRTVIARKCRDQVPDALRERVWRALMEASKRPPSAEYEWE
ncbi:MAG TPA: mycothiol system anti-sigma-R factor [Acidimicrobiales bacterium]|jgi:mycothiol system anti-sigma-R factor|nr:mycothiol system anti-sigma-R factor [Acidimicrobiales bacterium]